MSKSGLNAAGRTSRREWLMAAASLFAVVAVPSIGSAARRAPKLAVKLAVKRNPGCGCCVGWADHMRAAGFEIELTDHPNLNEFKAGLGVPSELYGCHTGEGEGYVFEGHIPAPVIQRFLREKPAAKGIAVAGMPAGSPGMESSSPEAYDVVAWDGKKTWVFEKIAAG